MVNEKTLKREYGGKDWIVLCKKQGALRKMNKPKPQHFAEVKLLWYCPYYVFQKRNRVMISSGSNPPAGLGTTRLFGSHIKRSVNGF